jgi:hypothetical protein
VYSIFPREHLVANAKPSFRGPIAVPALSPPARTGDGSRAQGPQPPATASLAAVAHRSALPPDAPLLLYPTPCATVTSLNDTRVLLAGEGSFGDPVRDLTDVGDGDGNLVARAQVLGRGSGVTDPFGCAR